MMRGKNRNILLILFGLLIVIFICPVALHADIKWLEDHYNFGAIREKDGPVDGKVRLINSGDKATFIRSVRPSCGCTAVSYTEDDIQPGDTATVSFTFDPTGRPGKFEKTIRVVAGEDDTVFSIKLYGTVIASDETLEIAFPFQAGPMRLEKIDIPGGDVRFGATRHLFLNVYNTSRDSITPVWKDPSPVIMTDLSPRVIPPGESGTFSFTIHSEDRELVGPEKFEIPIFPDGEDSLPAKVSLSLNFTADPSGMTAAELETLPYAILLPEVVDLGDVDLNASMKFTIEILNEGKEKLSVRKILPSSDAITISSFPTIVKGGKKGKITGRFHASRLTPGPFRINIDILTDDLLHPVRTARVVGEIK